MLCFKDRAASVRQTKFVAKQVIGLIRIQLHDLLGKNSYDTRSKDLNMPHPLPERRHRWIVSREERDGRQHTRNPGDACFLSDERTGERNRMSEQQVGSRYGLQQIVVAFAEKGEKH